MTDKNRQEIEALLNKYGVGTEAVTTTTESAVSVTFKVNTSLIEAISELIKREKQKAVEGFAEYVDSILPEIVGSDIFIDWSVLIDGYLNDIVSDEGKESNDHK